MSWKQLLQDNKIHRSVIIVVCQDETHLAALDRLSQICHGFVSGLSWVCHWFVIRPRFPFPANAKQRKIMGEAI